ncbi:MAG: hypothetical protein AAGF28_02155 [Pseudomonadota bacterium]
MGKTGRLISAVTAAALFVMQVPAFAGDVYSASAKQSVAKTKWPECFCTDRQGKRRELGDIICLTVDGRSYQAKCIMAQNNPFWRDLNKGCLSS